MSHDRSESSRQQSGAVVVPEQYFQRTKDPMVVRMGPPQFAVLALANKKMNEIFDTVLNDIFSLLVICKNTYASFFLKIEYSFVF